MPEWMDCRCLLSYASAGSWSWSLLMRENYYAMKLSSLQGIYAHPHLLVAKKIDCHTEICKSFIFLTMSILLWVCKSLHQLAFLVQEYTQMYIFILCCFPLLGSDVASFSCERHFTHFKWDFTCPWLLLHLQNIKPPYAYRVSCQIFMLMKGVISHQSQNCYFP
jgi:hypothetical protein